jgi:DMSO/TMAO reductase YedYZ molybdopterin-dependent catalytic subunit
MELPPGQRAVEGFPRFGTHLHRPPPAAPAAPAIELAGALREPLSVPLADLRGLHRRPLTADFHCVAGWSATGLEWEGVPFAALHRELIEPLLSPGATVTHFVFGGLDGYRAVVAAEDALADDVLIADRLHGRPLDAGHGAPVRLVSSGQYGYISVKHLCRIEAHTREPAENFGAASRTARALMVRPLFSRHPRSRVWAEERNGSLPNWLVRPVYRALTPPLRWLCSRGATDLPGRVPPPPAG